MERCNSDFKRVLFFNSYEDHCFKLGFNGFPTPWDAKINNFYVIEDVLVLWKN